MDINQVVSELAEKFKIDIASIESLSDTGFKMNDGTELSFSGLFGTESGKKTQAELDKEKEDLQKEIQRLTSEVNRLEPLAKDGEAFRKEVIDEALAAGIRAQGNDFPTETWKNTFASMGIEAIKDITKTFDKQSGTIPAGRITDPKAGTQTRIKANEIPDEAYKA